MEPKDRLLSNKKLKQAVDAGDRLRIANEFRTNNDEEDREWWNKNGKKMTGISYRDTKAAARMLNFLNDLDIQTEDL